ELHVRATGQALAQLGLERAVELDRVDSRDAIGEIRGQDAEARPDLEHDVVDVEVGESADDTEDVVVDEKVLPEPLLRTDAHRSWNATAAFASIWAPSVSTSTPRVCARAATVWMTNAGSFRFPRTGCGARYGQSVSASRRSAGTAAAAARSSSAFGYVTLPANDT